MRQSRRATSYDPGRTRASNLWFRRPTPYPLGHRTSCESLGLVSNKARACLTSCMRIRRQERARNCWSISPPRFSFLPFSVSFFWLDFLRWGISASARRWRSRYSPREACGVEIQYPCETGPSEMREGGGKDSEMRRACKDAHA